MKKYNDEPAIISLTSWKGRINIVSNTLFNLITMCPGFHIVLVLSTDEFPEQEKELPPILQGIIENNLIEVLWVKRNYKCLKKIFFTMQKYPNVPIISADDDCIYVYNYAAMLYECAKEHNAKIVTMDVKDYRNGNYTAGWATYYAPNCFPNIDEIIKTIDEPDMELFYENDDDFMEILRCNNEIYPVHAEQPYGCRIVMNTGVAQHDVYTQSDLHNKMRMKQANLTNGKIFSYLGL